VRIGIVATRLAGVDGVTFETAKWEAVLSSMGHEVRLCAGDVDALRPNTRLVPAMHFVYPPAALVSAAAFDPSSDPRVVRREIRRLARQLTAPLADWAEHFALDALIVENAWAIPMQLPLGLALRELVERTGLPTIGHHHDYWWERERFAGCVVPDILRAAFPPDLPTIRHVSINSPAAAQLRRRRRLHSVVVPNVFDFEQGRPSPRERARIRASLRAELGMGESGILVVQPTRVVPRKGIELAIDLVGRLGDPDAVLLLTSPAGDEGLAYLAELEDRAARARVELRYAADRFAPDQEGVPVDPAHSLNDAYIAADLITYPSLYEGFGNALVEAMFYRKPIVVNRYSVYDADIRPLGLRVVELQGAVSDSAVAEVRALLDDPARRERDTDHNFDVAHRHLGYEVLRERLEGLLAELQVAARR
jgi:glycosyltransferase involved in cell wall biosynthesis